MTKINKIYYEDCILGMKRMPNNSIDLIIADPPFGINFDSRAYRYNRKSENLIKGYVEVNYKDYYNFTFNWLSEAKRVLKDSGSIYISLGWNYLNKIERIIDKIGLIRLNHCIWVCGTTQAKAKKKYSSAHYHIYFLVKDVNKYKFNRVRLNMPDVFLMRRHRLSENIPKIGTKLPNKLVYDFILNSSNEGDVVLDPFMGNGTTAYNCIITNRKYIGFEANPNAKQAIDYWIDLGIKEDSIERLI